MRRDTPQPLAQHRAAEAEGGVCRHQRCAVIRAQTRGCASADESWGSLYSITL